MMTRLPGPCVHALDDLKHVKSSPQLHHTRSCQQSISRVHAVCKPGQHVLQSAKVGLGLHAVSALSKQSDVYQLVNIS